MAEKITYTLDIQAAAGPHLSTAGTNVVKAYDKVHVTLDDGGQDVEVNTQPSDNGPTQFMAIFSTEYGDQLTYKINATANDPIVLDGPQVFIGAGAVSLLDTGTSAMPEPATKLFFTNSLGSPVTIEILVGRDVASPPP